MTLSASAGRIAYLAAQAKRLYKPFTLESVTPEMRSPFVIVSVEPHKPYRDDDGVTVSAPIEHVVLKSKTNENVAIQPSRVDLEVVAFASVPGGKFESNRAVALFSYDAVRELPPGEFDIVVITAPGERRCKVGIGDSLKAVPEESMSVGFRPVGLRRPGDRSRRAK